MGAALLPPRGWAIIRRASEHGVSDETLAEKYDIPKAAIRLRRHREKWLSPARLEEAKAVALAKAETRTVTGAALKRMKQVDESEEGMGHVVEEIASLEEAGSLHFARLASTALTKKKSLTIRSVGDAVAAMKGLRTVAGKDKDAAISVNIGSWGAGSMRTVGGDLFDA